MSNKTRAWEVIEDIGPAHPKGTLIPADGMTNEFWELYRERLAPLQYTDPDDAMRNAAALVGRLDALHYDSNGSFRDKLTTMMLAMEAPQ